MSYIQAHPRLPRLHKKKYSMSYTYLLERGEESSAEYFSDMNLSVPWKSSPTAVKHSCNGNGMDSCHASQSGMTCEPSMGLRGVESQMLSVAASPVRTSPQPILTATDSKANALDSGEKWHGSFARFDHATSSWRTHQCSLFGGWEAYSETWPEWGIMRHGASWAVKKSGASNNAKEYGYWPALICSGWRAGGSIMQLRKLVEMEVTTEAEAQAMSGGSLRPERMDAWERPSEVAAGGRMNPAWGEWLMGWPIGWTDRTPLATDKFRLWLQKHGEHCTQLTANFLPKAE